MIFFGDEAAVSPDALSLGLTAFPAWMPLFYNFPESRKKLVERLIMIWSSDASDQARLGAFLSIHKAASLYPKMLEAFILKKMYSCFGKACKALSIHSMGRATFMMNGLVEVFTLDPTKSLAFASKALKALGALLQTAIKAPNKESIRKVYGWTFVWSLRFWARLCAHQPEANTWASLQTVVLQLINANLGYNFVPRFYAFHFHLIAAANEITRAKLVYFPVAPALLSILQKIVATQTKFEESGKPRVYDFTTIVKVAKTEASSRSYLDCAGEEALYLLGESLLTWSHSPSFPEMAQSVASQLRATEAINKSWKIAKLCGALAAKVEQHGVMAAQLRVKVGDMAPSKTSSSLKLTIAPEKDVLDQFHKHCQRIREQRRKLVASTTDAKSLQKSSKASVDSDDEEPKHIPQKPSKKASDKAAKKPQVKLEDLNDSEDELPELMSSIKNVKKMLKKTKEDKMVGKGLKTKKVRKSKEADSQSELEDFDIDNF